MGNSRTFANDGLDSLSVKVVAESLLKPINYLVNQSITTGKFANQWKLAKVIPLHKGKGLPKFNPSHYRPISLLPVIREEFKKKIKKLSFDQKWGGGRQKNQLANFIFYFSTNNEYGI